MSNSNNATNLNISPEQVAQLWNKKGLIYRKAGKLVESIECYDKALEIQPSNAAAWSNKARALDEMNMLPEALKCYKKALQLNPNSASTWNNYGYAYRKLKRFKEALECYDRAIEIWPQYDKAWFNKGYIYEQQERYIDALECFNHAIEYNPEHEKYIRSREIVIQTLKQQQQDTSPPSRSEKREKSSAAVGPLPINHPMASATSNSVDAKTVTTRDRAASTKSPAPVRTPAQSYPQQHSNSNYKSSSSSSHHQSPDPEEEMSDLDQAGADAFDVGAPSGHFSDGEVRLNSIPARTSPTSMSGHIALVSPVGSRPGTEPGSLRESSQFMQQHSQQIQQQPQYEAPGFIANFGNPFGFDSSGDETIQAPVEPSVMMPPPSIRSSQRSAALKTTRSIESQMDSLLFSEEPQQPQVTPPKTSMTPTKTTQHRPTLQEQQTRLHQELTNLAIQEQPVAPRRSGGSRSDPAIEIRSGQQTPTSSSGDLLIVKDLASPRYTSESTDADEIFEQMHDKLIAIDSIAGLCVFESRVEELLGTVRQRKQELQSKLSSTDDVKCSICLEEVPQMICIPCGHLCLCENCSKKLTKKKCPICNLKVNNIYKVFKA